MTGQPDPPELAVLEASVERITFLNEDSGFAVLRVQPLGKSYLVSAVGRLAAVHVGEQVRLRGRWGKHPTHGTQFEAEQCEVLLPTSVEGIRKYLGSGLIRGVGPVTADRLVRHFGVDTLEVIEQAPRRLEEAAGIGPTRARAIRAAWDEQKAIKEVMLFLAEHHVSTALGLNIYRQYGDDALRVVREAPYRLAQDVRGIGFKTADKIAASVGIAPDAPERAMAALSHILWEGAEDGHVYLPENRLLRLGQEMLAIPRTDIQTALASLIEAGELEREPRVGLPPIASTQGDLPGDETRRDRQLEISAAQAAGAAASDQPDAGPAIYQRAFARAEQGVAGRLRGLFHAREDRLALWQTVDFPRAFAWLGTTGDIQLAPEQAAAVRAALTQRVSVLTGGPGTGKTTTIRALLRLVRAKRGTFLLASPTGKAAKRLAEATGAPAKTLHRLLGVGFGGRVAHDDVNPLDADLIVVDEASMLDLLLANLLLKAIPRGAHLLLVGDVDQLPAVGPGNVLGDVIASEMVPVVRLEAIFRQAAESGIIVNAHRILHGQSPDLGGGSDFRFVAVDDPDVALDRVRELLLRLRGDTMGARRRMEPERGASTDLQVLTPMRVGKLGTTHLNETLQTALNPAAPDKAERSFGGRVFREGDRVICVKNNYRRETFNGDSGVVLAIDGLAQTLEMALDDGRTVQFDFADLDELLHAYALSVHRSQGSEYDTVVLILHTQHYVMLQRNLLYTAVSRARRRVIIVGSPRALAIAIKNDQRAVRFSGLAARLRGLGPREPRLTVIDDLDALRAYFAT